MSQYFVGIDISKYKHNCCIINAVGQSIVAKFTIENDKVSPYFISSAIFIPPSSSYN